MTAWATVATVAVRWVATLLANLAGGIVDPDSVQYHLPFAAEFAKTGWLTRFHPVWLDPIQVFYPANAEVVQAIGFIAMGRDVLAPLANAGWFAMLLLSGWCMGVRDRAAPLTLLVVAWITGIPLLAFTNSGSALTDVSMLACLAAAVALWRNGDGDAGWTAVSGLALGLAVGMKFTVLPTAGILGLAMVFAAPRSQRRRILGLVAATAAAGCSFWFLRNLLRTGSPLPSVALPFLHRTDLEVVDALGYPVWHYLFDPDVWRSTFWPGVRIFFGWSGLAALAAAGLAAAGLVRARRDRYLLGLAVAGGVGAVAYLFVPAGAWGPDGEPHLLLFTVNIRYLLPAIMVLGTAGAISLRSAPIRHQSVFGLALAVATAVEVIDYPSVYLPDTRRTVLALALVGSAAAAVIVVRRVAPARPRSPAAWGALAAVAGLGLVAASMIGAPGARSQLDQRREHYGANPTYAFVDTLEPGTRIGSFGTVDGYRLYGTEWENDVVYIGVPGSKGGFRVPRDCREYIETLRRLDVEYAIVGDPTVFVVRHVDLPTWTRPQPGATEILVDPPFTVFKLDPPYDPALCDTVR